MKIDSDLGDAWAFFYKFELQHGTEVSVHLGTGSRGRQQESLADGGYFVLGAAAALGHAHRCCSLSGFQMRRLRLSRLVLSEHEQACVVLFKGHCH